MKIWNVKRYANRNFKLVFLKSLEFKNIWIKLRLRCANTCLNMEI